MQQVYVVLSQANYLRGTKGVPLAVYPDYPSALAYAQTIFKRALGSKEEPKDLVFLLSMSTTNPKSSAVTG